MHLRWKRNQGRNQLSEALVRDRVRIMLFLAFLVQKQKAIITLSLTLTLLGGRIGPKA